MVRIWPAYVVVVFVVLTLLPDAKGADLVLLKAGQTFCPRSPSTFRTCVEGMV